MMLMSSLQRVSTIVCLSTLMLVYLPAWNGVAADWPAFRGPNGNGMTDEPDTPIRWSQDQNILWKAPLVRPGNGSPIVVGNRVLCSLAEDDAGLKRSLLCFDAQSGNLLWSRTETVDQEFPTHVTNPYGGTTPGSDGERVVVWHASAGLFAYTLAGKPLWSRKLGEFRHEWGYGTSPIIVGDRVILHTGPGKKVFVSAFRIADGEQLWSHAEPVEGDGEKNLQGKYMGSWATPVPVEHAGRKLVVCSMAKRVCAWDVANGQLVWFSSGIAGPKGDLAYSSPLIENGLCVALAGFGGPAMAFRIGGSNDITDSNRLWRNEQNPQSIGSGLLLKGIAYRLGAGPSVIQCQDAESGKMLWEERGEAGSYWGSISYNGKYAYATDQKGTTLIFEPSAESLKTIAANELKEPSNATPALAGGRVYIRTAEHLWCIGSK